MQVIPQLAEQNNLTPFQYSFNIVKEKEPEIRRYVAKYGNEPSDNLLELAAQATLTHENSIARVMNRQHVPYDVAEEVVLEQAAAQNYDGDYSDFAPALIAVITAVGKVGVNAINAKREKDGKRPILSGGFWDKLKGKTKNIDMGSDGGDLLLRIRSDEALDPNSPLYLMRKELERQAQQDWMNKNLPIIIVVVITVFCLMWFVIKKHHSK